MRLTHTALAMLLGYHVKHKNCVGVNDCDCLGGVFAGFARSLHSLCDTGNKLEVCTLNFFHSKKKILFCWILSLLKGLW